MASELDALTGEFQNYIVSPLNAFGLGGFVFDVEGESTTKLEAEITDHYTEDNKAVQDHIARKPKLITLRGYVGELVYKPDGETASSILQTVTQKLTTLSAFLPTVSTATAQLQAVATNGTIGFNEGLSDAADIYGLVQNLIGSTGDMAQQQAAYLYFKACWEQGILMGIQTPWEFLTNMAIQNVVAIQAEGSKYITDFSVTYKQMRFAKTVSAATPQAYTGASSNNTNSLGYTGNYPAVEPVEAQNLDGSPVIQGDAALQAPNPVSIGSVTGASLPTSFLQGAQSYITQGSDLLSNPNILKIFQHAGAQ